MEEFEERDGRSKSDSVSMRLGSSTNMEIGNYVTTGVMLGRGAFGTVELARDKRDPENTVAIKCISKANIIRENMGNQVSKEVSILKNLKHPNIVRIEQVLMSSEYLYICMEYVTGGELFSKLAMATLFTEEVCKKYMAQLCDALQYCHGLNVCHRDIKPQNILLDNEDNVKLVDFGFASIMEIDVNKNSPRRVQRDPSKKNIMDGSVTPEEEMKRNMEAPSVLMKDTHTICGTASYMAPEIMTRNTYMGDKVDIWALGTVCYFLLTGRLPFKPTDMKREKYVVPSIGKNAINFLSKMLTVVPEDRFSARNLLNHAWLKTARNNISRQNSYNRNRTNNNSQNTDKTEEEEEEEDSSDEEDEEIEFELKTKLDLGDIVDQIIDNIKEHDWSVKIERLGTLKVSKLEGIGMNMVIINVDKQDEKCTVCIQNGSAMRVASRQSKIRLEEIIVCSFDI